MCLLLHPLIGAPRIPTNPWDMASSCGSLHKFVHAIVLRFFFDSFSFELIVDRCYFFLSFIHERKENRTLKTKLKRQEERQKKKKKQAGEEKRDPE